MLPSAERRGELTHGHHADRLPGRGAGAPEAQPATATAVAKSRFRPCRGPKRLNLAAHACAYSTGTL